MEKNNSTPHPNFNISGKGKKRDLEKGIDMKNEALLGRGRLECPNSDLGTP